MRLDLPNRAHGAAATWRRRGQRAGRETGQRGRATRVTCRLGGQTTRARRREGRKAGRRGQHAGWRGPGGADGAGDANERAPGAEHGDEGGASGGREGGGGIALEVARRADAGRKARGMFHVKHSEGRAAAGGEKPPIGSGRRPGAAGHGGDQRATRGLGARRRGRNGRRGRVGGRCRGRAGDPRTRAPRRAARGGG